MPTRRELRAGAALAGPVIPARLLRFDAADWPPSAAEPDEMTGSGDYAAAVARFCARRRYRRARERFARANGMTAGELCRIAGAGELGPSSVRQVRPQGPAGRPP